MSICNVYLPRNRQSALCITDTRYEQAGKPAGHAAKFVVVPHLRAGFFGRGSIQFFLIVIQYVALAKYIDFDNLRDLLPGICQESRVWHLKQVGAMPGAAAPELTVVGWSRRAGGYVAARYPDSTDFAPIDLQPGISIAPSPPGFHIAPGDIEPTQRHHVAIVEQQLAQLRTEVGEDTGSGGHLTQISFGPDGAFLIRVIHELSTVEPHEATARAYRDTVRELLPAVDDA